MQSWRTPDDLLRTTHQLPNEIAFEYIYDGGGSRADPKHLQMLQNQVMQLSEQSKKDNEFIKEYVSLLHAR